MPASSPEAHCGRRYFGSLRYWHLRDRWWVPPTEADRTGKGFSDRHYYRLLTADHQVFEIYRELTSAGLWVLDIVQD
jgi:hypothetical protein